MFVYIFQENFLNFINFINCWLINNYKKNYSVLKF
jgi:hypothetical protein